MRLFNFWWRHKCVTLHIIKVYFIELLLTLNVFSFEDKILIKTYENENFLQILLFKKLKKMNIRQLFVKLWTTGSIKCTAQSRQPVVSKCAVFLLGSVEKQLG